MLTSLQQTVRVIGNFSNRKLDFIPEMNNFVSNQNFNGKFQRKIKFQQLLAVQKTEVLWTMVKHGLYHMLAKTWCLMTLIGNTLMHYVQEPDALELVIVIQSAGYLEIQSCIILFKLVLCWLCSSYWFFSFTQLCGSHSGNIKCNICSHPPNNLLLLLPNESFPKSCHCW